MEVSQNYVGTRDLVTDTFVFDGLHYVHLLHRVAFLFNSWHVCYAALCGLLVASSVFVLKNSDLRWGLSLLCYH